MKPLGRFISPANFSSYEMYLGRVYFDVGRDSEQVVRIGLDGGCVVPKHACVALNLGDIFLDAFGRETGE